jgi:hypothetical protein
MRIPAFEVLNVVLLMRAEAGIANRLSKPHERVFRMSRTPEFR